MISTATDALFQRSSRALLAQDEASDGRDGAEVLCGQLLIRRRHPEPALQKRYDLQDAGGVDEPTLDELLIGLGRRGFVPKEKGLDDKFLDLALYL